MTEMPQNQAKSPETANAKPTKKPLQEKSTDELLKATSASKRRVFENEETGLLFIHRLGHHEAELLFDEMTRDDTGKITDPYDDAKVIARCVRDSAGKPKFQESDLPRIQAMGNDVFLALVEACLTINGMGVAGREAIAKNSRATPPNASGSG